MRGVENTLSTTSASDLARGTEIAEYVIEQIIGRGGMSVVYRATHPQIGSRVAIKVLAMDRLHDPHAVSRFIQEARTANEIRHRNIVDVFTLGRLESGQAYCVMEYLEGVSLARHLLDGRSMSIADTLAVLQPVARALDAAHAKGVVHRDIKPANIFLVRDPDSRDIGQVKLLDFGIAKLLAGSAIHAEHRTETGSWVGTPAYMPPEQWNAKDVDERADIYSLGVVAYQMLTGQLPYRAEGFADMVLQQTQPPVPASRLVPALPPAVDAALARALHRDPAARFARASELVAAVADAAATHAPSRRRRIWIPLAAAAGIAAAIAAVAWWPRSQAAPAAEVSAQRPAPLPAPPPPPPPAAAPAPALAIDPPRAPARPAPTVTPRAHSPHKPASSAPETPHGDVVPEMPVKL